MDGQRCEYCAKMDATWNAWYELACRYYREHGNLDIPKRDAYEGKNLGLWLQRQRNEYEAGKLSAEQIQKLEVLGFAWDTLKAEWNRRYEQYKRYVAQNNGNPYISRRTDFEGEHLGAWVETQRKWYAAGKMSEERLQKLRAVNDKFPKV